MVRSGFTINFINIQTDTEKRQHLCIAHPAELKRVSFLLTFSLVNVFHFYRATYASAVYAVIVRLLVRMSVRPSVRGRQRKLKTALHSSLIIRPSLTLLARQHHEVPSASGRQTHVFFDEIAV